MKIRYLEHSQIDKAAWDNCIARAVNGNLSAWSWFLDIMSPEWGALIEGKYDTVFPLPGRKKAGIHYVYQPFFSQQLGIFSVHPLTPEKIGQFLDAIPQKFGYIDINLNSFNKPDPEKYTILSNLNHELDLIESHETISKSYKENTRRNIGRAKKEGVSVHTNVRPEDVVNLFRSNRGKDFGYLRDQDYRRLLRLVYHCLGIGKAICYGAYTPDNTLCAAAILVFSHRKAIFLFSGVNDIARKNGAMSFLIDRFIQDSAGNHLTLDFEGSNDRNLARFYSSFGASALTYPSVTINRLPWPVKFLPWLRGRLRKMR